MKTIFIVVILSILIQVSFSQGVISAAGETFTRGEYKISWTLGELVIETVSNGNNILTQGFHQSKLLVTSVLPVLDNYEISVYPNPANEFINFQIKGIQFSDVTADIYSMEGKLLKQHELTNENSVLKVQEFANGSYLLKISKGGECLRIFKVIKQY